MQTRNGFYKSDAEKRFAELVEGFNDHVVSTARAGKMVGLKTEEIFAAELMARLSQWLSTLPPDLAEVVLSDLRDGADSLRSGVPMGAIREH